MQKSREVMKVLEKANVQLKVDKCKIACKKIEWLCYEITGSGISPVNGKFQGITERLTDIYSVKLLGCKTIVLWMKNVFECGYC